MQGSGIFVVDARSLCKFLGDLDLGVTEDYAGLSFSFGLSLLRHGILKRLWNTDVANLDRLYGDTPWSGLLVENLLQFASEGLAFRDHLGELMATDGFAKRGLGTEAYCLGEVFDFKNGLFGIPDEPEDDGVDVHGDGVASEGRLGANGTDADALIDEAA